MATGNCFVINSQWLLSLSFFLRSTLKVASTLRRINIQKTKIMVSGTITSWEIDGETAETVSDFIFWGSQITVDGDCCCCCWVTSVVSDSVRPHRWQPTRLLCPWDSPGKNTRVGCHFLPQCMKVKSESEVAQSCPTLSDPMDCSLPGSSVHGIFQARVLEWGATAFSDGVYSHAIKTLTPWKESYDQTR